MPKVERLVKLARLTRDREAVSIREMSEACGVSQRTIYRYLNTLSGLDFTGSLPKSAGRGAGSGRTPAEWRAEDLCLLCYVLQNNPLTTYPFFRKRLKRVRQSLLATAKEALQSGSDGVVQYARSGSGALNPAASKILDRFEKARLKSALVELQLNGRRRKPLNLRPKAIRIAGATVFLEFAVPNQRKMFRIDLKQVKSLAVSRRRRGETGARGRPAR
jgi:predicted DNA-binding transcriptional regulator AlpA